jgi:hypothetical protein
MSQINVEESVLSSFLIWCLWSEKRMSERTSQ